MTDRALDGAVPEYTGLGCGRCGDCCEAIAMTKNSPDMLAVVSTSGGMALLQPRRDKPHGTRRRDSPVAGEYMRDAAFIRAHMHPTGRVVRHGDVVKQVLTCDAFDPESRLCTAHDQRPVMCSGFPDYGRGDYRPNPQDMRCSFWLDVPPEDRPEGARPLIPLTVITRG